jgi:hypothetical protein
VTTRIIYPSEQCWPDIFDLRTIVRNLKLQTDPKEIYPDFRALYEWFRIVLRFCHNHGKHNFVEANYVLNLAEGFIGRSLNEDAFRAAVRTNDLRVRYERKDLDSMLIKVPDFGRIQEASVLWDRHIAQYNQQPSLINERSNDE